MALEIRDIIENLNFSLLNSDCDIVECLKKARYVAKHFNESEMLEWIEDELNGYSNKLLGDLPSYRKIKALMYTRNGMKPCDFRYPLSIEDVILRSKEESELYRLTHYVDEPQLGIKGEFDFLINTSEFKNIINAVNIKLSDYIEEKLEFIEKILLKTSNNKTEIKLFLEKLFWKPTVKISKTRFFKNESGLHSRLLEKIKTQLNEYQFIELHNIRDEISIDLLFKCTKFNWKIGISVEATSDIAEIKEDKRNVSFPKEIKSKMKDIERITDLDLFLILFCIDLTVKSYRDTLTITLAEIEKINDPKVLYYVPENLVSFFKNDNTVESKANF